MYNYKISKVFKYLGDELSIADAMQALMALFPGDPYARHKAAGALGGASKSGFIVLKDNNWARQR